MQARIARGDRYINPGARDFRVEPVSLAALSFHRRFPGYNPTPLRECPAVAKSLQVGRVFVKEEAGRFGLPSFKMVGALWGVYRALVARSAQPGRAWSFDELALQFGGENGLTPRLRNGRQPWQGSRSYRQTTESRGARLRPG